MWDNEQGSSMQIIFIFKRLRTKGVYSQHHGKIARCQPRTPSTVLFPMSDCLCDLVRREQVHLYGLWGQAGDSPVHRATGLGVMSHSVHHVELMNANMWLVALNSSPPCYSETEMGLALPKSPRRVFKRHWSLQQGTLPPWRPVWLQWSSVSVQSVLQTQSPIVCYTVDQVHCTPVVRYFIFFRSKISFLQQKKMFIIFLSIKARWKHHLFLSVLLFKKGIYWHSPYIPFLLVPLPIFIKIEEAGRWMWRRQWPWWREDGLQVIVKHLTHIFIHALGN